MDANKVLAVVLREMTAYGRGWRMNWSDFDGRDLRRQLDEIETWATAALMDPDDLDYREGSEFYEEQSR